MLQLYFEFQFDEAFNNINKAFLLAADSSDAHYVASHYYGIINDKEGMVKEAELALHADPLSLMKNNQLGEALLSAGRIGEAEEQLTKTLEMDSNWRTPLRNLQWLYMTGGDYEKSLEMCELIRRGVNVPGKGTTGYIATLLLLGRKDEANVLFEQLIRRSEIEPNISLHIYLAFC